MFARIFFTLCVHFSGRRNRLDRMANIAARRWTLQVDVDVWPCDRPRKSAPFAVRWDEQQIVLKNTDRILEFFTQLIFASGNWKHEINNHLLLGSLLMKYFYNGPFHHQNSDVVYRSFHKPFTHNLSLQYCPESTKGPIHINTLLCNPFPAQTVKTID